MLVHSVASQDGGKRRAADLVDRFLISDPTRPRERATRQIVAIALEGFTPLDLALVASVFGARRANGSLLYSFAICGLEAGRIDGADGFAMTARQSFRDLDNGEIVIVPGSNRSDWARCHALVEALRRAYDRGAIVVGIRGGVSVLTSVGLVPRGRAKIVTCVSTVAALEYCLQVVRSDWGEAIASELARELVGRPSLSGQVDATGSSTSSDAFERTLEWMKTNTHRTITIDAVAARACMSKRHFMRRFSEATGTTPKQWLLNRRVGAAQDFLVDSDLPLKQIAARVGFPSVRALRDQLRRRTGKSAMAHRAEQRRRSS